MYFGPRPGPVLQLRCCFYTLRARSGLPPDLDNSGPGERKSELGRRVAHRHAERHWGESVSYSLRLLTYFWATIGGNEQRFDVRNRHKYGHRSAGAEHYVCSHDYWDERE